MTAMTQRLTIGSSTNYLNKDFSVTVAAPYPALSFNLTSAPRRCDLILCQCGLIQSQHGYNTEQTALTNLIN